ncbi:MAG: hypothetical protein ACFFED_03300 [Candidatus Thorarchaeota archaeon]
MRDLNEVPMKDVLDHYQEKRSERVISVLVFLTLFVPYLIAIDTGLIGLISVVYGISFTAQQGFIFTIPLLYPVSIILWAPNALFSYIAYKSYLGESSDGYFIAALAFSLWYVNLWGGLFGLISIDFHFPVPLLHIAGIYYYLEGRDRGVKHVW